VLALEFFGGVPRLIVPDQTRALIKNPDRYDPSPTACTKSSPPLRLRPAGRKARAPRDKPKVENAVLVVSAGSWRACATASSSAWL
jgi:transposase